MQTPYGNSSRRLALRLGELGFAQLGNGTFESDRYRLELGKTFSTFHLRQVPPMPDPLTEQLGKPGPWKRICERGVCQLIADVPLAAIGEYCNLDGDDDGGVLERVLSWVANTSSGCTFATWQPPESEEIESWYGPEKLTVMVGPHLAQGTLLREPGRLAVRMPIVPAIPADLPGARMNWLRYVLIDAQNRHRAVRIGISGHARSQAVVAEVDLSGAPLTVMETLFTMSLAALKSAVQWSIQSADFLVDLGTECRALEVCPQPVA